jgi:ATP-dependent Clp protease adaptor protein ClpS
MKPQLKDKDAVLNKTETPRMYLVMLHNDDFTSQDFVVRLLMDVFGKTFEDARTLMLRIHVSDEPVAVGSFTLDIARSKKSLADRLAEQNGFPLFISIEPEGHIN